MPPAVRLLRPKASSRREAIVGCVALLVCSAGIAVADAQAQHSTGKGHFAVFWLAVVPVVLGVAWRVTRPDHGERWRLGHLVGLGVFTFVPKLLLSPGGPLYFDEFAHFRHANDMLATGAVDVPSTFLPIMRYYPGLELLTAALHIVTGLPVWHVGQVVVGLAHITVLLLVYQTGRTLNLPAPRAALAAVIFSTNPSFMYFDTQFAYESVGIALAFGAVLCVLRATRAHEPALIFVWSAWSFVLGLGCLITHHVSAVLMVAGMCAVVVTPLLRRRWAPSTLARTLPPAVATVAVLVGTLLWLLVVAGDTGGYIGPHLSVGWDQLRLLLPGSHTGPSPGTKHTPFAGNAVPRYELLAAFAAPPLVLLACVAGAWSSRPGRPEFLLRLPYVVLAALYFASLPLALTAGGGESAHRFWGFAYLGVGLVTAAAELPRWLPTAARHVAVGLLLAVLLVGNVAAGVNIPFRFPGPYTFGSDTRSTTPERVDLAGWVRQNLPPYAHVVTDRTTGSYLTGYTTVQVPAPTEGAAYGLYAQGDRPTETVLQVLRRAQLRYFVLDRRILTQEPEVDFFQGYVGLASIDRSALTQIGGTGFMVLLHSTEHYRVYRLDLAPS